MEPITSEQAIEVLDRMLALQLEPVERLRNLPYVWDRYVEAWREGRFDAITALRDILRIKARAVSPDMEAFAVELRALVRGLRFDNKLPKWHHASESIRRLVEMDTEAVGSRAAYVSGASEMVYAMIFGLWHQGQITEPGI